MANYRSAVQSLDLKGSQVVVSGGTNGIGKGIALLLASLGCSVAIVGRTPSAGEATLAELKAIMDQLKLADGEERPRVAFIQADLSLVPGIHQAAKDITTWAGEKGIQYLFQTQGIAAGANLNPNSEGIDTPFAVQAVSRFGIPYLLFESNTLHETSTIANIALAGFGKSYIPSADDLDTGKKGTTGFVERCRNTCAVIDCTIKQLSVLHPKAKVVHLWPGAVRTSVVSRSQSPWWIRAAAVVFTPIPGIYITPEEHALRAVYTICCQERLTSLCWDEKSRPIAISRAAEMDNVRQAIWERLVQIVDGK